MAKISKQLLSKHNKAVELLDKKVGKLNFIEREQVFEDYHEGAGKMNNLISAHFTPKSVAVSMSHNVRCGNWVDLCAGIGSLSYQLVRQSEFESNKNYTGICVENCQEYYEIGKKLLPECIWILGSIFDQKVIDEIKLIMSWDGKTKQFSIISNPPYGNQVKGNHELMNYTGSNFEYKAMEIGAILGAYDGAFLIPQQSAPFRITGSVGEVNNEKHKSDDYMKFSVQTNLEISPNIGFTTEIPEGEENWKDVSITTEIGIVEYSELNYKSKKEKIEKSQITLF